jgi:hypothetical protein
MLKILTKKIHALLSTFDVLTKSIQEKTILCVSCVDKIWCKKSFALDICVLFTQETKNVGFPQNLACTNQMSEMYALIFCLNFLTF